MTHTLDSEAADPIPQSVSTSSTLESEASAKIQYRTVAEFKKFYHENLADDLKGFDKLRKQVLIQILIVEVIILVGLGVLLNLTPVILSLGQSAMRFEDALVGNSLLNSFIQITLIWLGGIMSLVWAGVAFLSSSIEVYTRGFKGRVIQKIVHFVNPDKNLSYLKYSSKQETLASLNHCCLFPPLNRGGRIHQDNCVSGKIGKTDLFFSEIRAEMEVVGNLISKIRYGLIFIVRPDNPITAPIFVLSLIFRLLKVPPYIISHAIKRKQINYKHFEEEVIYGTNTGRQIFKGLFFVADFNKHFRGKTFVLSNDAGAKLQALHKAKGQSVQLEDPDFKKLFVAYSNDQVEARYILSTTLMERLVNFRRKAKRKIQISFVDSLIYVAIAYDEDLFEPKLFTSMLDLRPLQEYFEIMQLMLGIVDDLNLNQRIWTKQ
jgi:hypothetical protein